MLWDPSKDKPIVDEIGKCCLKAIEVLEQRGWCKGSLMNASGQVCVVGAIQLTACSLKEKDDALQLLHKTLGLVGTWNDAPERTKDEVTDKLREIAYAKRP